MAENEVENRTDGKGLLAEVSAYLEQADEREAHVLGLEMSPAYRRLMLGEIGPAEYAKEVKKGGARGHADRLALDEPELTRAIVRWLEADAMFQAQLSRRAARRRYVRTRFRRPGSIRQVLARFAPEGIGTMLALSWRLIILPLVATLGVAFLTRQSMVLVTDGFYIKVWLLWPVVLVLFGLAMLWRESREPDFLPLIKHENDSLR